MLVNCAGIGPPKRIVGRDGPMPLAEFEQRDRDQPDRHLQHDAAVRRGDVSKAEPLAGGERGVIISTASVAAFEGQIGQAAYSSSKGGVVALTMPAAREFAQFGIRVMTIAPGIFQTPMLAALPKEAQDGLGASVPFPRAARHSRENIADLVAAIVEQRLSQWRDHPPRRRAAHGAALNFRTDMLSNCRSVRIEWGDCDPAGIIFYPRYFAMFDHSTAMLISAASGMSKAEMLKTLRFRRLSAGRRPGALHHADAVRR